MEQETDDNIDNTCDDNNLPEIFDIHESEMIFGGLALINYNNINICFDKIKYFLLIIFE